MNGPIPSTMRARLVVEVSAQQRSKYENFWMVLLLSMHQEIVKKGKSCPAYLACKGTNPHLAKVVSLLGYPSDFLTQLADSAELEHKQPPGMRSKRSNRSFLG